MRLYRSLFLLALVPTLAFLLAAPGCSSKKPAGRSSGDLEDLQDDSAKGGGEEMKVAVDSKGWGSVEGFVSYDGTPPAPESMKPEMDKHNDHAVCEAGKEVETIKQTWIVGKNKGVA